MPRRKQPDPAWDCEIKDHRQALLEQGPGPALRLPSGTVFLWRRFTRSNWPPIGTKILLLLSLDGCFDLRLGHYSSILEMIRVHGATLGYPGPPPFDLHPWDKRLMAWATWSEPKPKETK